MRDPARMVPSLPETARVVNVGLPLFADAVTAQGAEVVSVEWRVPAGGQPAAVAALGRLYGRHAEQVDLANAEVVRRLDQGTPLLTGIRTVAEVIGGQPGRMLLHCGPAIGYGDAPDPLRRSMRAAVVSAGWAAGPQAAHLMLDRGEIALSPANEHRVVVPMATALEPAAPVYVVENAAGGTTAFAPISQGPGDVAWFGGDSEAAIARLVFLREVAAPVIRQVLQRTGPLDVLALAAQAVTMGDDSHVRTQAATNVLIRDWLPHLSDLADPARVAFARFLSGNHLFFLTIAMAAARSLTEWAAQVPGSSIVTSMARNGAAFGIRLVGGSSSAAAALTERLADVCAGRSSRFKIPVLGMAGTPLGVDVRKVVESGITPAVTTGILHRSAGTGQVGAGVAEAPAGCFAAALADLDRRLAGPGQSARSSMPTSIGGDDATVLET